MIPITRITEPGSNHQLTISELIAMLDTLRQEQVTRAVVNALEI